MSSRHKMFSVSNMTPEQVGALLGQQRITIALQHTDHLCAKGGFQASSECSYRQGRSTAYWSPGMESGRCKWLQAEAASRHACGENGLELDGCYFTIEVQMDQDDTKHLITRCSLPVMHASTNWFNCPATVGNQTACKWAERGPALWLRLSFPGRQWRRP